MAEARTLLCVSMLVLAADLPASATQSDTVGDPFNAAVAFYRRNELKDAYSFFVKAAARDTTDPIVLAWLAETLRRLEQPERAIPIARRALAHSPCQSFAHEVLAAAFNPQYVTGGGDYDSVWVHLQRAVECDPNDGNGWLNIWGEALRRGDRTVEERALRRLKETDFFTRTTLSYNRWLVRDLPPDAVILANGDLDMYPVLAMQLTDGLRRDISVVNMPMLNLWWYVLLVHTRYGLALPGDSAALASRPMCGGGGGGDTVCLANLVLTEWRRLAATGGFARPLATVTDDGFPSGPGVFVRTGPMVVLRPDSPSLVDTAAVWRSLRGIDGKDFAGPVTSSMDRSAIRISSGAAKGMLLHIVWTAELDGRQLLEARRLHEARKVLEWMRRFARDAMFDTPDGRDLIENYERDLIAAERAR